MTELVVWYLYNILYDSDITKNAGIGPIPILMPISLWPEVLRLNELRCILALQC